LVGINPPKISNKKPELRAKSRLFFHAEIREIRGKGNRFEGEMEDG